MPTRDGRLIRIHTNSTALNADVRLAAVAAETAGLPAPTSPASSSRRRRRRYSEQSRCRPVKTRSPTAR